MPVTESVSLLTQQYTKKVFDRRYRGSYMGRSVVREYAKADDAFGSADPFMPVEQQFAALYPDDLSHRFEHFRNLEQEKETLRALRDGLLEPPDGVIRHRGVILKRKNLPKAIEEIREECDEARRDLCEHDRMVRGAHNVAAANISSAWQAYHTGLVQLLHYADHSSANLTDVHGRLGNLWSVIIADGNVSSGELKELLIVCKDVYTVLQSIDAAAPELRLSGDIAQRLGWRSWQDGISEAFVLPEPTKENISDWLGAAESWISYYQNALGGLQAEALETLLAAEAKIEQSAIHASDPGAPPSPGGITVDYPLLLPNSERKLQRRLGLWDRFQTATGFFPALTRFGVAMTIVGGLLGAGIYSSSIATITMFNGLATTVLVSVSGAPVTLAPMTSVETSASTSAELVIETHTREGILIQSVEVDASNAFDTYVYNVANAMPLVRWEVTYGSRGGSEPVYLGADTWLTTNVDYLFEEPPDSINTSSSGGSRSVLSEFRDFDPRYLADYFPDGAGSDATIRSHALWDHPNSLYTSLWLALATRFADFDDILSVRLQRNPNEVMALRFEQEADNAGRAEVCNRHIEEARAASDNMDWQYLAARCRSRGEPGSTPFIDLHTAVTDNPWINAAAGYEFAETGRWEEAVAVWESAFLANIGMQVYYADDIARGRRMLRGTEAEFTDLARVSPWLEFQESLQSEEVQATPVLAAYQRMRIGDLEGAIGGTEGSVSDEMRRMVAASDGATDEMVERALAMDPGQGLSEETIWVAIGFAIRHGRPIDDFLAEADEVLGRDADVARDFFANLSDTSAAEKTLDGVEQLEMRGLAYAGGVVALGQRAPDEWRETARRLLFITERPYFR